MKKGLKQQFQNKFEYKARRQGLRSKPTKAEYVLWQEIRKKKLGIRFRRQCSVGPFVVDFCSYEMNLVIEVDGPIHEYQQEYDERREHYILRNGYKIVRYTNEEVLFHRDKVLEALKRIIGVYLS